MGIDSGLTWMWFAIMSLCLRRAWMIFTFLASVLAQSACGVATAVGDHDMIPDHFTLECLAKAETEIQQVPDKQAVVVTTSQVFKRDLASYFCPMAPEGFTVLELGVYLGHTTTMLASIFERVIAVDVEQEYLRRSAAAGRRNVMFLSLDSYATDWRLFGASSIDVVVIDADHKYEKVRSDAIGILAHLSPVRYVVFDDYGVEHDVRRVVSELLSISAVRNCIAIGEGKDGRPWYLNTFDWVNHSEGVICERGPGEVATSQAAYTDVTFLVYAVPADALVRPEAVMSFKPTGIVYSSPFGLGEWTDVNEEPDGRDVLHMRVPGLPPEGMGIWEVLFNKGRSAFVLTPEGQTFTRWFGMRADKVNQVLRIASEQFD